MAKANTENPRREDAQEAPKQKFFFPDYGVTVEAVSQEEAEKIVKSLNTNK